MVDRSNLLFGVVTLLACTAAGFATFTLVRGGEDLSNASSGQSDSAATETPIATSSVSPPRSDSVSAEAPTPTETSRRWILSTGVLTMHQAGMSDAVFEALYRPECEEEAGGPGLGTVVSAVDTHDLTGDGIPEAVVSVECVPSTSSWPETVLVLDGGAGSGNAAILATLIDGNARGSDPTAALLREFEFAFNGTTVTVFGEGVSATGATNNADLAFSQSFTWENGHIVSGEPKLRPIGRAAHPDQCDRANIYCN